MRFWHEIINSSRAKIKLVIVFNSMLITVMRWARYWFFQCLGSWNLVDKIITVFTAYCKADY
jgi:hypothetical protein